MLFRKTWMIMLIGSLFLVSFGIGALAKDTGPVEIRFRYFSWPAHAESAEKWVSLFNERYMPVIKLVWDGFAGDNERAKDITMLMAGAGDVDILLCDSPWVSEFASKGWLLPLDPFMEDKEAFLSPFYEFSKAIGNYEGVQYGIPRSLDESFLYYRKDILEEKGLSVPTTLDELVYVAQQVNSPPNLYGFLFQGAQYSTRVWYVRGSKCSTTLVARFSVNLARIPLVEWLVREYVSLIARQRYRPLN